MSLLPLPGPTGAPVIQPGAMMPAPGRIVPTFSERLGGLLFPSGQYPGVDPTVQAQLQKNALLTLGLGMMAGSKRGLAQSALGGLQAASGNYDTAMQRAYQAAERERIEGREDQQRAEDNDWKKTVFGAQESRAAREEQATADWRKTQAELEAKRIEIARRTAVSGTADDQAVADLRRLQADELRTRQELMTNLRNKVAQGIALTQDEKDTWQMVMTGRQPTENPWAALLQGGMGGATPPMGQQTNRVLDAMKDQRW